jgi:molybdopterin molybdotransferase
MIGLPGNPVSTLVIAHLVVKPLIEHMIGLARSPLQPVITARVMVNLPSIAGRDEYFPVRLIHEGEGYLADPIFYKSNLIYSLVRADGLVHIEPDITGVDAGTLMDVSLF